MTWIDWVALAVLGLGALQGFRRGFLLLLAETGGAVLSLYLAARYHPAVVAWLDERFGLVRKTADLIAQRFALAAGAPLSAGAPAPALLELAGVPPDLARAFRPALGAAAAASPAGPAQLIGAAATRLAELLWTGVAFVIGAALVGLAVRWIAAAVSLALDGAIGLPNRLAGAALGAARNALLLGAIAGIVVPIVAGPGAARALLGSRVVAWLGQAVVALLGLWLGPRLPHP